MKRMYFRIIQTFESNNAIRFAFAANLNFFFVSSVYIRIIDFYFPPKKVVLFT